MSLPIGCLSRPATPSTRTLLTEEDQTPHGASCPLVFLYFHQTVFLFWTFHEVPSDPLVFPVTYLFLSFARFPSSQAFSFFIWHSIFITWHSMHSTGTEKYKRRSLCLSTVYFHIIQLSYFFYLTVLSWTIVIPVRKQLSYKGIRKEHCHRGSME